MVLGHGPPPLLAVSFLDEAAMPTAEMRMDLERKFHEKMAKADEDDHQFAKEDEQVESNLNAAIKELNDSDSLLKDEIAQMGPFTFYMKFRFR